jgi:hypothetical protein
MSILGYQRLPDGVLCKHPGCLSHLTHPCEGCGRIGGISRVNEEEPMKIIVHTDELINDLSRIADLKLSKTTRLILHTNQEIIPGSTYVLIDGEEVYPSALSMFTEIYSQGRKVEI